LSKYSGIQKEETLKGLIFKDFFDGKKFGYEPNIDNIDFVITDAKMRGELFTAEGSGSSVHYLWAEAKKGVQDVESMLTQLLLTCKKTYDKAEWTAPPFIGCFDTEKIAFAPFHCLLSIFHENDINWNAAPSNHDSPDFIKARSKVINLILTDLVVFQFDTDEREIKEFVINNFAAGASSVKRPITKDNFVQIFTKWVKEVEPAINISKDDWADFKANGILECDFYRADIMSTDGNTISISEKLKIILEKDNYKLQEHIKGRLFSTIIDFTDGGEAYRRFWNKYERPPADEYQQYIIDRRDLLVPQNIREVKGSFFTPEVWVKKSQEYIAKVFGRTWQEEYYVWDCAAGTVNLLAGLSNKYKVWASTLDQSDVDTMNALIDIDEQLNLLPGHVFQFDFLNDYIEKPHDENIEWTDKLPSELRRIIDDPEKRKKLIIYINPPYAEATSATTITETGHNKIAVATVHKTRGKYQPIIGAATNELYAQFMARIYKELPMCKLAQFSTLKFVCTQHFMKFRKFFNADYKAGFIVHADTFDNVHGKFPIGFTVWDLDGKRFPEFIEVDIVEEGGKKKFWDDFDKSINQWIKQFDNKTIPGIGFMGNYAPDFQNMHQPYITVKKGTHHVNYFCFNNANIIEGCIYLAVRICIEPTWLNNRDQFYYPNDGWKNDIEFQNDCLVVTLFHAQNRISANDGNAHCVNHWIPFTPEQVDAKEMFESAFMSNFLKGMTLSSEAQSVLDAGLALWRYYHAKTKGNKTVSVNASFYDIREYFQGRNDKGTMNTKSADETYTQLLGALRDALKTLTQKIQPKVYEYGFLRE
jgi:hypothetical protein